MLFLKLRKDLAALVGPGSLDDIVFDLIRVALREGWATQLVWAAFKYNPGSPELKRFCDDHPDLIKSLEHVAPPDWTNLVYLPPGHSKGLVPRFKVFISYAPVNDRFRWVSQFAHQLRLQLSSEVWFQAEVEVWLDEAPPHANEPVRADPRGDISSSDIYLAVLSRGYCHNPRCKQEREAFLVRWKEDARNRLFVIRHSPIDPDDPACPQEFKGLAGFSFYRHEDPNDPTSFAVTLGEDQERPDQAYIVRVKKVAREIAEKLYKIDQAQRLKEPTRPVPIPHAAPSQPPHVNLVVVAPKDMGPEAQALHQRIRDTGRLSIEGGDVPLVPTIAADVPTVYEQLNPGNRSSCDVMLLVVWSELGEGSDGRNHASLVEGAFRAALQLKVAVFLYRCNREVSLSFRPDDPAFETKVMGLRSVTQFFDLINDGTHRGTHLRQFRTAEELLAHFESDLKEHVSRMVARPRRAAVAAPSPAPADPRADELLKDYLKWVVQKHERLELRGIGGTAALATIPLEDVYVALRGVRASDNERQQSRKLFQAELFSLVRALPQAISADEFARLVEEAELQALIENPLMPLLVERDRPGAEARQGAEVVMSLGEAFRTERWLVVLGDPGSGKTTLLRWIARKLALALLCDPPQRVEALTYQVDPSVGRSETRKVDLGPARLPVLVRVSEYSDALLKARQQGDVLPLADFLGSGKHTWQGELYEGGGPPLNALIKTFLEQGRAVVLLDGMDEVTASSQRDEVVHAIEAFIAHAGRAALPRGAPFEAGGNQVFITSRIAGYHASPIAGPVGHVTVQPMQRRAVEHFCDAWTLAVNRQALPGDEALALEKARAEAAGLKAEIFSPHSPQVWELARNPLLITILALISRRAKGRLPRQRSELYHAALEILIENWRFAGISTEELIYVLSPLAAKIHSESSTGLIREDALREVITRELARYRNESPDDPPPQFVREVKSFLRRVRDDVGLLAERGPKLFGFLHLTFQEYLAGLYVVRERSSAGQAIVDRLDDPRWREPILLALGHVSTNSDWGPGARMKLLRQILDADDPLGELLPRGPLLVIQALPEMESVADELVGELLDRLLRAYTASATDEVSVALARQIEKAMNTVYNSAHQAQVVAELVRMMEDAAGDRGRALACASLIRANGWRNPEFVGPLLRCQVYDEARWALPVTNLLRAWVTPELPDTDLGEAEREVHELRSKLDAVRDGSFERSLRAEIQDLERRLAETGGAT